MCASSTRGFVDDALDLIEQKRPQRSQCISGLHWSSKLILSISAVADGSVGGIGPTAVMLNQVRLKL